jgi:hypothetical protein
MTSVDTDHVLTRLKEMTEGYNAKQRKHTRDWLGPLLCALHGAMDAQTSAMWRIGQAKTSGAMTVIPSSGGRMQASGAGEGAGFEGMVSWGRVRVGKVR